MPDARPTLAGRRVVITGAASGIGLATARAAIDQGARVALLDVDDQALRAVVREMLRGSTVPWFAADVSDEVQIEIASRSIAEVLGGVDCLIHAAGVMRAQRQPIRDVSLADWEFVTRVNLTGTFLVLRAFFPHLRQANHGVALVLSSRGGVESGSGSLPYGASKGGVHGLVMSLEAETYSAGIRLHEVLPPLVDTPLVRASIEAGYRLRGDEAERQRLLANLHDASDVAADILLVTSGARGVGDTVVGLPLEAAQ